MASTSSQKEVNELKKLVIANGFKLVPSGAGHWKLLSKKGAVVVDRDGPVILSSTASDVRARDMHVKRLMAVGALKADPWKPNQKIEERAEGDRPKRGFDPEAIKRAHETQAANSRERGEKTKKVRERIEPFIAALGGWEKRGLPSEFARAAYFYLKNANRVEAWKSESGALQNMTQLKLGNTLGEDSMKAWHLFMDEIERAGGTIDDRRARYFDLVRSSKGLATTAQQAMPEPGGDLARIVQVVADTVPAQIPGAARPVTPQPATAETETNGYEYNGRVPDLALRALAEMMQSRPGDPGIVGYPGEKRERALEIAKEILDMEITQMLGITHGVRVGV